MLIDQGDGFVFGFSKLDVMFGRTVADAVVHPYRDLVKPGVTFVQTTIRSIDPVARRVETDAGPFDGDLMVVALGADLHPADTPGPARGRQRVLHGGRRVRPPRRAGRVRGRTGDRRRDLDAVQVPAGTQRDRAAHARLPHRSRPARRVDHLAGDAPAGTDPTVAGCLRGAARRLRRARHRVACRVGWSAGSIPTRKVALLSDDTELPYDLFLGIPVHRAPAVVEASGLTVDGWIPVDPLTLETQFHDGVYAVGDVTSVGTPKAGVSRHNRSPCARGRGCSARCGATCTCRRISAAVSLTTRSPSRKPVTPWPIPATVPPNSCPRTTGMLTGHECVLRDW